MNRAIHQEDQIIFTAEDVRQFTYCPRIIYFRYVMNVNPPPRTYKMKKGEEKHDNDVRKCKNDPSSTPQTYTNLYLKDEALGLIALLDFLEVEGDEAVPVDLKTGKSYGETISEHHFAQLVVQALLVESQLGLYVRRVRVNYSRLKKIQERIIKISDKLSILDALQKMRRIIDIELIPNPTHYENKCVDCEYWRYCYRI